MGRIRLHLPRKTLLVSLCTLVAGGCACFFIAYLAKPQTGLVVNFPETVMEGGRVVYAPKTPFSPAAAGGLLPGRDAILSVAGMPISDTRDLIRADARLNSFQPFEVQVLRDGSEARTLTLTPVFAMSRIDWILILLLAASLSFAAFAMSAWAPEDAATVYMVLACLSYLLFTCMKPFYYSSLFSNTVIQAGRFSAWLLVFFALWFPEPRGGSAFRISFVAAVLTILLLFSAARLSLYSRWAATGWERWLERYRALGQIGNVSDALAYLCLAGLLVLSRVRAKSAADRKRVDWILAGILLALPPYFFLDQLPIIVGQSQQMRVGLGNLSGLFLSILPVSIVIGVLGRRVLDIRFLAVRYLVYGILLAVVLGFFTLLAPPLRSLLSSWYSLTPVLSETMTASLLFICLVPLRALLIRAADRLFWQEAYRSSLAHVRELEMRNEQMSLLLDREGRDASRGAGRRLLDDLRRIVHGVCLGLEDPGKAAEAFRRLAGILDGGDAHGAPTRQSCRTLLDAASARVRRDHPQAVILPEGEGDPVILCRPEEVSEALARVMGNAVEACGGRAEVVGARFAQQDGTVEIEIQDHGPGFDPRMTQEAFRPFVSARKGHEGLGLCLARLFTEANAGTLEIRPPSRQGAAILFRFPSAGGDPGTTGRRRVS